MSPCEAEAPALAEYELEPCALCAALAALAAAAAAAAASAACRCEVRAAALALDVASCLASVFCLAWLAVTIGLLPLHGGLDGQLEVIGRVQVRLPGREQVGRLLAERAGHGVVGL